MLGCVGWQLERGGHVFGIQFSDMGYREMKLIGWQKRALWRGVAWCGYRKCRRDGPAM